MRRGGVEEVESERRVRNRWITCGEDTFPFAPFRVPHGNWKIQEFGYESQCAPQWSHSPARSACSLGSKYRLPNEEGGPLTFPFLLRFRPFPQSE